MASSQAGVPDATVPRYRNRTFVSSMSFAIIVLKRNAS